MNEQISVQKLLEIIGQQAVELHMLRQRLAELTQEIQKSKNMPNTPEGGGANGK